MSKRRIRRQVQNLKFFKKVARFAVFNHFKQSIFLFEMVIFLIKQNESSEKKFTVLLYRRPTSSKGCR
ncbi:hypothetical protein A0U40_02610 [[Bacillus] sp. KCTC 13219]|nr:hypothetical protein A0U40_02610 [[Bacillus] sp. KCTC 13219]